MGLHLSPVDELEAAVQSESQEQCQTLRSVTDFRLKDAERLSEAQSRSLTKYYLSSTDDPQITARRQFPSLSFQLIPS
jgi:hypothetical protein